MSEIDRTADPRWDVIVVGAGFAGLYALHRLRQQGFRVRVLEAADGLGGTWYWNRYPGARCDIQSLVYCYTFDEQLHREWPWSERYATQPEILRYLNFVADRLDLRKDISFRTFVSRAVFNDGTLSWTLTTREGETVGARYVLMATGALSVSRMPGVEGLQSFKGDWYHTGRWPDRLTSFVDKRVGIIGTGSSGVQVIPLIAEEARHLTVFQRTAAFVAPARNAAVSAADVDHLYRNFAAYRTALQNGTVSGVGDVARHVPLHSDKPKLKDLEPKEREARLQAGWETGGLAMNILFSDVLSDPHSNSVVAEFYRARIRDTVKDPHVAQRLTPKGYPYLSKRVSVGTNYYETFNRDNVTLVDVEHAPIEAFTANGLRTAEREYEFDAIILATGFDALTGALAAIDILGTDGERLRRIWAQEGPQAYLGISIAGFPNLFMVNGPGSPGILGNVVVAIEQHVDWITELLIHARREGFACIAADAAAQREWARHVNEAAFETLLVKGKNWWMKERTTPRREKVFVPYVRGLGPYVQICDRVVSEGYRGFHLTLPASS
jgi:cyclohexanone monooxygenase